MDDLVKRGRELADLDARSGEPLGKHMRLMADRIEADAKRIADLALDALAAETQAEEAYQAQLKAEARIAELEAAMERIAAPCSVSATADWRIMYEAWRALCVERVDIARAALGEEKE